MGLRRVVAIGGVVVEVDIDPAFHSLWRDLAVLPAAVAVDCLSPGGALSIDLQKPTEEGVPSQAGGFLCVSQLDSESHYCRQSWKLPLNWSGSLKNLLVPFLNRVASPKGGLFVHAAAVGFGNHALMIVGPSGAGKSTAARQLAGHILSDDIVFVSSTESRHRVRSTDLGRVSDGQKECELAGILFPRKSRALRLRPMSTRESLPRFLRENSFYLCQQNFTCLQEQLNLNIVGMLDAVPSFELDFPMSPLPSAAILAAVLDKRALAPPTCGIQERVDQTAN